MYRRKDLAFIVLFQIALTVVISCAKPIKGKINEDLSSSELRFLIIPSERVH